MTGPVPFDGGDELDTFWSRLVDARHDLANLLQVIARQVTDTLGDGCVLTVLRDDGTTLDPVAVTHRDPQVEAAMRAVLEDTPSSVGEGLAGSAAADQRSICMNDLAPATGESTTPSQYLPFVRDHPMRAIVIAPMVASGRLVGTLGAVRTRSDAPYEPADLQRLEGLAERAAHAIDEATAAPQAVGVADYEAIYRHVADGVVITTPDGHILAVNPAACSILGMSEREIRLGGREAIAIHDDRFTAGMAERARSGHVQGEMHFRRGDGTTIPVHVSSSIYVTRDRSPRAVVVFSDIDAALETPGGRITWSIGIVEHPAHDRRSLTALVDAADHAM